MYAQDSIDMLTEAGIQFKRHEEDGIRVGDFAELLISSGLVLCEDVIWIAFARCVPCSFVVTIKVLPYYLKIFSVVVMILDTWSDC